MSMVPKRILVPTDFSKTAAGAYEISTLIAEELSAEVHLLHVRQLATEAHLDDKQMAHLEELMTQTDDKVRAELGRLGDEGKATVVPHIERGFSPAETTVEAVKKHDCDLVVMGTNGRRTLKTLLFGSVAEEVVRTAPTPVMVVRSEAGVRDWKLDHFLVAHDFSARSQVAVEQAAAWARALDAEVILLHVVEPVVYPDFYALETLPEDRMEGVMERAKAALDEIAATTLGDVEHQVRVRIGDPTTVICEQTDEVEADIVFVATRGLSDFKQVLLGSVAEGVARASSVPVTMVRTPD